MIDAEGRVEFKDGRTRHRAQTNRATILGLFKEATAFIKSKVSEENTSLSLNDLRRKLPKKLPDLTSGDTSIERRIVESLPSQDICDQLVQLWYQRGTILQQILHRHVFDRHYTGFWSQDVEQRSKNRFAPCLLMIVSLTSLCHPKGTAPSLQYSCKLVNTWLLEKPNKILAELLTLQAQTLFVIGLQCASSSSAKIWRESGSLLRSAMLAGLHSDSRQVNEQSRSISEQRKQLWAVVVEQDLQASLLCGLPPAISKDDYVNYSNQEEFTPLEILRKTMSMRLEGARLPQNNNLDIGRITTNMKETAWYQSL